MHVVRSLGRWVIVGRRVVLRWILVARPVARWMLIGRKVVLRWILVARPVRSRVFVDRRSGIVIGTLLARNRTPVHFVFFFS
jgi:hypothetical protein